MSLSTIMPDKSVFSKSLSRGSLACIPRLLASGVLGADAWVVGMLCVTLNARRLDVIDSWNQVNGTARLFCIPTILVIY